MDESFPRSHPENDRFRNNIANPASRLHQNSESLPVRRTYQVAHIMFLKLVMRQTLKPGTGSFVTIVITNEFVIFLTTKGKHLWLSWWQQWTRRQNWEGLRWWERRDRRRLSDYSHIWRWLWLRELIQLQLIGKGLQDVGRSNYGFSSHTNSFSLPPRAMVKFQPLPVTNEKS